MARSRTIQILLSVPMLIVTGFVVMFYSILALFLVLTAGGIDQAVPAHTAGHVRVVAALSWLIVLGIFAGQIVVTVLRIKANKSAILFGIAASVLEIIVIGIALNQTGM